MDLILWRHADAEFGEPDLERSLSAKGHQQAAKMAEWLSKQLPPDCEILCSPAKRTQQTLEPLIKISGRSFRTHPALAPYSSSAKILEAADWPNNKKTVLVISHQPILGEVAATLMTGRRSEWTIRKGDVWWIAQHSRVENFVKAVMSADLLLESTSS